MFASMGPVFFRYLLQSVSFICLACLIHRSQTSRVLVGKNLVSSLFASASNEIE
ncbi:unnamed protein product, partial [Amoebophrya sp. A120]|eukprot:GSA120T00023239001.1